VSTRRDSCDAKGRRTAAIGKAVARARKMARAMAKAKMKSEEDGEELNADEEDREDGYGTAGLTPYKAELCGSNVPHNEKPGN